MLYLYTVEAPDLRFVVLMNYLRMSREWWSTYLVSAGKYLIQSGDFTQLICWPDFFASFFQLCRTDQTARVQLHTPGTWLSCLLCQPMPMLTIHSWSRVPSAACNQINFRGVSQVFSGPRDRVTAIIIVSSLMMVRTEIWFCQRRTPSLCPLSGFIDESVNFIQPKVTCIKYRLKLNI